MRKKIFENMQFGTKVIFTDQLLLIQTTRPLVKSV